MREQIGTVNILAQRLYPRYPVMSPGSQLTSDDQIVQVDAGKWPVYRGDDGLISWEMQGELIKIERSFNSLGDGMFMERHKVQPQGELVIFSSMTFTDEEFAEFRAVDPLVTGDDSVRRLVFEVKL